MMTNVSEVEPKSGARKCSCNLALAAVLAGVLSASAARPDTLVVVTSTAAQTASDSVQWAQLGADGTILGSSFNVTSAGSAQVGVALAGPNSIISVVCPGASSAQCSWTGPGATPNDSLLWTSNAGNGGNGPVTLSFSKSVYGAGALIQADAPGQFTAQVSAYNSGTLLGSFTVTSNASGAPVYVGVLDQSGANVNRVVFNVTSCTDPGGVCNDFGIDTVNIAATAAPFPALSPISLTFPVQQLNTPSSPSPVTLSNTGTAPLSITNIAATGDFSETNTCPSSLAVGGSCTIKVTFTPSTAGLRSGSLVITDNAKGSPQSVPLNGTGYGALANLSTGSLTFTPQSIGMPSAPQTVMLTNGGTAPLTITSIVASGDFQQTSNCTSPLQATSTCTITVTFTPTTSGTRSGAVTITDSANNSPQSITLTGIGVATTPLVTSGPSSALRNNFTGFVGMEFTVGSTALTVTQLGRWVASGNMQTHTVKLVNASTGVDVPGGAVQINTATASQGHYAYAALASALTLAANTSYYVVSQETGGGDQWYDAGAVTANSFAVVNGCVYLSGSYVLSKTGSYAYVPVNLQFYTDTPSVAVTSPSNGATESGTISLSANATAAAGFSIASVQFQVNGSNVGAAVTSAPYTLAFNTATLLDGVYTVTAVATDSSGNTAISAPVVMMVSNGNSGGTPLLTGTPSAVLRNNFSGFVGIEFTVGSSAITVTQLGRWVVSGNAQVHTVQLVNAATGMAVPGGSVSLDLSGVTAGRYAYTSLASPIVLQPNTSYYLVSLETNGGDQWYNTGPVTANSAVVMNGSAFLSGNYTIAQGGAYAFGPVNLEFSPDAPAVSVTSPSNGATVSGTIALSANASPAAGYSISSVQFQVNGSNVGAAVTSAPYTIAFNTATVFDGTYLLRAVATDSAGNVAASAPIQIIVSNGNPPGTPFLTGAPASTLRNNFSGFVGMKFTVGNAGLTVTQLGRWVVSGNTQTHTVQLVNATSGVAVPGGSVQINTAAVTQGQYAYAALASPVVLQPNTSYYLVSLETAGGDQWYDVGQVTANKVAVVNGTAYLNGSSYAIGTAGSYAWVPVNFTFYSDAPSVAVTSPSNGATESGTISLSANATPAAGFSIASVQFQLNGSNVGAADTTAPYTIPFNTATLLDGVYTVTAVATDSGGNTATSAPVEMMVSNGNPGGTPLLTSTPSASLRNNFGGFVGMKFTVGSSGITVTQLGRWVVAGNGQTHIIKLVNASTGVDLPGGSVSLDLSGVTAGRYAYTSLATPIVLQANTSYYLVSLETVGGDQWYDVGPVTANSAAVVNGTAYLYGTYTIGLAGSYAYGPVNLEFSSDAPTVAVTSPSNGATVSGTIALSANASPAAGFSITSVQFQMNGSNVGAAVTSAPYTIAFNTATLFDGTYLLRAVATDSAGDVAVSAPIQVIVSNGNSSGTPFLTGAPASVLRNNYSGFVGMKFTVGSAGLLVTQLGRWVVSGNTQTHTVQLVNATSGVAVPGGSVQINTAAVTQGQYAYAALASPLTLAANTSYYLVSQETNGGDQWYDIGQVTANKGAVVNGTAYLNGSSYAIGTAGSYAWVPVNFTFYSDAPTVAVASPSNGSTVSGTISLSANATPAAGFSIASVQFQVNGSNVGAADTSAPYTMPFNTATLLDGVYTVTAVATDSGGNTATSVPVEIMVSNGNSGGTPLLTGTPSAALRNNFSGFVGMEFTVGTSAITVTQLGRWVVSGNSQTHIVKLVNASTGVDLPGGSVSLDLSGVTAGQYAYTSLASPIVLQPNTSYYLVSLETAGGDQWYNIGPVTANSAVVMNGSAFLYGNYTLSQGGAYAYGPVNLEFSSDAPAVSVTSPSNGATVSGTIALSANASPAAGYSISSVQFQVNGSNVGAAVTSAPYTIAFNTATVFDGTYLLRAVATDSAGNVAASAPVQIIVSNGNPPGTPFLTGAPSSTLRNNFSGFVGMKFTVGSAGLLVTQLGRWVVSGNTQTHTVQLVNATSGAAVPGGSVQINTAAVTQGQYAYAALASPLTLAANTSYYLVSQETNGGDQWYDIGQVTANSAGVVNGTAYQNGSSYSVGTAGSYAWVPVNFTFFSDAPSVAVTSPSNGATESGTISLSANATAAAGFSMASVQFQVNGSNVGAAVTSAPYTIAFNTATLLDGVYTVTAVATDSGGNTATSAPVEMTVSNGNSGGTSLLTGAPSAALLNDFSGFIGMEFTVGSASVTVRQLGRWVVAGNNQTHIVKLVNASTGVDLPGGSVSLDLSGVTAGQYAYTSLASPIVLQPNTSYYLVSQETNGGDQWYNTGPVTANSAAVVNGSVYLSGSYTISQSGSYAYGPVSLLFH